MKRLINRRSIARVMSLAMAVAIVCALSITAWSAESAPEPEYDTSSELKLDVVFVVDYSGSMIYSDPQNVAKEACTLFTNMCDYDQARVGAVLFTTKIEYTLPITELSSAENRDMVFHWLDTMEYTVSGDTDISLGLTAAKDLLVSSGSLDGGRQPLIIFLSDGKTDRISAERQAVYDQELTDTLQSLSANGVPVYSIGLTNSDTLDEATLIRMAEETGGKYYPTKTADSLDSILSEILAFQIRTKVETIAEFDSDGTATTVTIPIPNSSIYQANIIIMSEKGVSDIHLRNPGATEVVIPSDKVNRVDSSAYTLIKLITPEMGDWTLTLTGADKDHITVNLLNSYDMYLSILADKEEVTKGESVDFQLVMSDPDQMLEDSDLFSGATGKLMLANNATGVTDEIDLMDNGSSMSGAYLFDTAGDYTVLADITGKDAAFHKTASLPIKVKPVAFSKITDKEETTAFLFAKLFGIGILSEKTVPLDEVFEWDDQDKLTAQAYPGNWEDRCQVEYDAESNEVRVTALKGGSSTVRMIVTDLYGQSGEFSIRVIALPLWLPVVLLLLIVLIICLIVRGSKKRKRPYLKGKLRLVVTPPRTTDTPGALTVDLAAMNTKDAVSLDRIIRENETMSAQYMTVLAPISSFVNTLSFEAADGDGNMLHVHVPASGKNAQIEVDHQVTVEKKKSFNLAKNGSLAISYTENDMMYVFDFSLQGEGWESGFGGGTGGGFGGFGGDNGNGFGGFGGNTGGGFGGFGGNAGGGFGGFGGNSGGGFGGFGGDTGSSGGGFGGFGGDTGGSSGGGFGGFGGDNGGNDGNDGGGFGGFGGDTGSNDVGGFGGDTGGGFGGFGGSTGGGFGGFGSSDDDSNSGFGSF